MSIKPRRQWMVIDFEVFVYFIHNFALIIKIG